MNPEVETAQAAIEAGLATKSEIAGTSMVLDRTLEGRKDPLRENFLKMCLELSHREWEAISTLRNLKLTLPGTTVENTPVSTEEIIPQPKADLKLSVRNLIREYLGQSKFPVSIATLATHIRERRPELSAPKNNIYAILSKNSEFERVGMGVYRLRNQANQSHATLEEMTTTIE